MRIGLFVTCLTDTLFPDTGKAVVALLERLGHQVEFPAGQERGQRAGNLCLRGILHLFQPILAERLKAKELSCGA